jgi:hypothetical protein
MILVSVKYGNYRLPRHEKFNFQAKLNFEVCIGLVSCTRHDILEAIPHIEVIPEDVYQNVQLHDAKYQD